MKGEQKMITINDLAALKNNDGLTIRNGSPITYKSGWQVADFGKECRTAQEALKIIADFGYNAGVWFSDGIFYIDHSFRVSTKKEALKLGKMYNQISVLCWRTMKLAYCKD